MFKKKIYYLHTTNNTLAFILLYYNLYYIYKQLKPTFTTKLTKQREIQDENAL